VSGRTTKMAISPEETENDIQAQYDFRTMRGVVRGRYVARCRERLRVVRLAEDVAGAFADEAAVNGALREYLRGPPSTGSPAGQGAAVDPLP
jgi:hypothetical protein